MSRNGEQPQGITLPKPLNFDRMMAIEEILLKDFPHVRVDLYNTAGWLYFGELTLFSGSGYMIFNPDSFDEALGRDIDITNV